MVPFVVFGGVFDVIGVEEFGFDAEDAVDLLGEGLESGVISSFGGEVRADGKRLLLMFATCVAVGIGTGVVDGVGDIMFDDEVGDVAGAFGVGAGVFVCVVSGAGIGHVGTEVFPALEEFL